MKQSILAVLVLAGAAPPVVGPVAAKQETVAGTWTLTVEHIGMKLSLEQRKSTVTGTLDWPHGDPIKLAGIFADDTLVFSGNSAGENFTIHVDATGTRKADDTLAGTVRAHFDEFNDAHEVVRTRNQDIPWTAARGVHGVVQFGW